MGSKTLYTILLYWITIYVPKYLLNMWFVYLIIWLYDLIQSHGMLFHFDCEHCQNVALYAYVFATYLNIFIIHKNGAW